MSEAPEGAKYLSPALQRWVGRVNETRVPVGTPYVVADFSLRVHRAKGALDVVFCGKQIRLEEREDHSLGTSHGPHVGARLTLWDRCLRRHSLLQHGGWASGV